MNKNDTSSNVVIPHHIAHTGNNLSFKNQLTLLLPSNELTSFTLGVNLTPAIKTYRK